MSYLIYMMNKKKDKAMNADTLMTISEIAEELRCSVQHVRNLIKRGDLGRYKNGKAYLFSRERHLQPYLESVEQSPSL